jgi:hypothetical protein
LLNNVWDENTHDSKVLPEFAPVEELLCSNPSTCDRRRCLRGPGSLPSDGAADIRIGRSEPRC